MGVSPARVTNIFKGRRNFTLATLVEAAHALDCDLSIALVPRKPDAVGERRTPDGALAGASIAAEAPARYRAARGLRATRASRLRDDEIRAHLASGKLRVEGDRILMRHERDGAYHPATFRRSSAHSAMEKTNVGRRAYYRERILAVAGEMAASR
jgi:transcriptional regulator with XRE-family HTH domain